uniref:Secreted protein n=1 Tax=Ascaris lumbricoides TaxID=6252 RepID=A0A0M3IPQ1_ASCLU
MTTHNRRILSVCSFLNVHCAQLFCSKYSAGRDASVYSASERTLDSMQFSNEIQVLRGFIQTNEPIYSDHILVVRLFHIYSSWKPRFFASLTS